MGLAFRWKNGLAYHNHNVQSMAYIFIPNDAVSTESHVMAHYVTD